MPVPPDVSIPSDDIRRMTRAQLVAHFGSKQSGRVVMARLMRGLILQAHQRISSGQEPPIDGNLRTFWYRWVKPLLARIPDDDDLKTDLTQLLGMAFFELVVERGWIAYKDFDFTDENWSHRLVGARSPHVLVFAEKVGWMRFLRRCHEELGVSVLALGGAPSALTSEYTVAALREVVASGQTLHLLGIVDYDPSGDIIARAFESQLQRLGWPETTLEQLIHPRHYDPSDLPWARVDLPGGQPTKTQQWLDAGGGLDGEAWGLEAESMPWQTLRALLEQRVEPLR